MTSNFSWFVSGPVSKVGSEGGFTRSCLSTTHVLCLQNFSEAEAQLNEKVKKFWDLDSAGIRDDEVSVYEKHASEIEFKKGQREVGLPLKNHPAVGDNFDKCCNRLRKLKERLDKKPEHLKKCNDIIQDQLNKGVVEVVDEEPSDEKCFEGGMTYLSHREVKVEDKSCNKLQIVYDASAK